MCGIVGFVDFAGKFRNVDPHSVLWRMLEKISARGPNGRGVWHESPAHLGHTRLSIIDLTESSSQPFKLDSDDLVIVYNGEVYNYQALRQELIGLGERFFSQGDTEVVVRGFKRFGWHWLRRLNGMFAAAIWDRQEQRLTLFRDRFGIKPLYWTMVDGAVAFASQITSLLRFPGVNARLNLAWLNEYLTFQYAHGSITPFDGVFLIQPGNALVFESGSASPVECRWAPEREYSPVRGLSLAQATESIIESFNAAVRNALTSDVPVGSYLSGGIDSGAVVTVASRYQEQLHTFTCGIEDTGLSTRSKSFDETEQARTIASIAGCRFHHRKIAPSDILQMHGRVLETIEEPRVGVLYQNDSAARLASSTVSVCLSGAGGDELFGGYPWRYRTIRNARNREEFLRGYYGFWQRVFSDEEKARFIKAEVFQETDASRPFNIFSKQFPEGFDYADIGARTWLCLKYECEFFLHGLLQIGDRLAGAYGMEERFPFLDNDLVALVDTIPAEYHWDPYEKTKNGQFYSGKHLLRAALARIVAPQVAARPKQGFTIPAQEWFAGPLSKFVEEQLDAKHARLLEFLNPDIIEYARASNQTGRSVSAAQIWSLLSLETMLKTFF